MKAQIQRLVVADAYLNERPELAQGEGLLSLCSLHKFRNEVWAACDSVEQEVMYHDDFLMYCANIKTACAALTSCMLSVLSQKKELSSSLKLERQEAEAYRKAQEKAARRAEEQQKKEDDRASKLAATSGESPSKKGAKPRINAGDGSNPWFAQARKSLI